MIPKGVVVGLVRPFVFPKFISKTHARSMKNIISAKVLFKIRDIFSKYLNYRILVFLWGIVGILTFVLLDFKFAILILILVFLHIGGFVSGFILRQKQYWKSKQIYYLFDGLISNAFDISIVLLVYFLGMSQQDSVFVFLAVILIFINQLIRVSRESAKVETLELFMDELFVFIGTLIAVLIGLSVFLFLI